MAETGRRLTVIGGQMVVVESFDVPEPGPGQVLVRVSRSQVSAGSERRRFRGAVEADPSLPLGYLETPLGYTTVGRVEAVGSGVADFREGDRVFAVGRHTSHHVVVTVHEGENGLVRPVQHVDPELTDEQVCFSRLGDVALHAIRRAELQTGESVAVFGMGVVGQLIAAFARRAGAYPVIALDPEPERLGYAEISGATHTVDLSSDNAADAIMGITGRGAQTLFHANWNAQSLADCIDSAAYAGKVVLVGATRGILEMRLRNLLVREIDVRGSHFVDDYSHKYYPWTTGGDRDTIMRMIASGELSVDHLITHVEQPEAADEIFKMIVASPKGWMAVFFDWRN